MTPYLKALPFTALLLLSPAPPPSRQADLYKQGTEALDAERWDRAVQSFDKAAEEAGDRADAALYWKAYAQNRLGRKADAGATLQELKKRFPDSRWLKDARALEVEMRGGGEGALVAAEDDEELKLVALGGLMHADPSRALPLVEKILAGRGSEQVKQRALFVLGQSSAPEARALLFDVARGKRNRELQEEALQQLGVMGGNDARKVLDEVYAASDDPEVKERVLSSYMVAGDRGRLKAAARGEKNEQLRAHAITQLGAMGATAELWEIYQSETSRNVKETVLNGFGMAGDAEHLVTIARSEKDPLLRPQAVRRLGMVRRDRTEAPLLALYRAERDHAVKEAVAEALMMSNNARAMVELARGESDRSMKALLVQRLSTMRSKEATDYMLEILGK